MLSTNSTAVSHILELEKMCLLCEPRPSKDFRSRVKVLQLQLLSNLLSQFPICGTTSLKNWLQQLMILKCNSQLLRRFEEAPFTKYRHTGVNDPIRLRR